MGGAGGRQPRGGAGPWRQKLAPHPTFCHYLCHYRNGGGPPGVSAELPAGKSLPQWPPPLPQAQLCPAHPAPAPLPAPAARGLLWHRGALGVGGGGGSVHAPGLCPPSRGSSSILRATGEETKTPAERGLGLWALSRWEILPGLPPSEYRSEVSETPASAQAGERLSTVPKAFWVRLRSRVLTEISLADSRGGEASFSTLLPRRKEAHILDTTAALLGNKLPFPRCHQPPNTSWERSGSPHLSSPASPASRTELARSCRCRTTPLPPTSSPSLGPRERARLPRPGPSNTHPTLAGTPGLQWSCFRCRPALEP